MSAARHVHILGASGSGTTTLGRAIARACGWAFHDVDDYYWLPTEPPFREKRERGERLALLTRALDASGPWVLSGSLVSWGAPLVDRFELVIYLSTATELRVERLRRREAERGVPPEHREEFLRWAAQYEEGRLEGRSRRIHDEFIASLACPVLRLDGARPLEQLCAEALAAAGVRRTHEA